MDRMNTMNTMNTPAAMNGSHDTDMHDMTSPGATGTVDDMVETVYVAEITEEAAPSGFRWWYVVPAVALPVAAGAAVTTLWLLQRRNEEPAPAKLPENVMQRIRRWLDDADLRQRAAQAGDLLQQGAQWTRERAQELPARLSSLQETVQEQLPESTMLRERLDQLAEQISAIREQVPVMVSALGERAQASAQPLVAAVDAAKQRTLATRDVASQTLDDASTQATRITNQTLAFGLGAVLAATVTYVSLWRRYLASKEAK